MEYYKLRNVPEILLGKFIIVELHRYKYNFDTGVAKVYVNTDDLLGIIGGVPFIINPWTENYGTTKWFLTLDIEQTEEILKELNIRLIEKSLHSSGFWVFKMENTDG